METYIVDSFTDEAFKGNPAGVCLVKTEIDDKLMQSIAIELNLSETAFIRKLDETKYSIRYFSPKMEIPLCGHATLAASKILMQFYNLEEITFITSEKINLKIEQREDFIAMTFPIYHIKPTTPNSKLLTALGLSKYIEANYNEETRIIMIEIESKDVLANLNPDFTALLSSQSDINGVLVTAIDRTPQYDFHSRYFWPWSGTNEDPVTGGTHTFMAPYWASKLKKKYLKSYQSSQRSGFMDIEILDSENLIILGVAKATFKGELLF
ncbi:MAG: PhzF family phenazine biosynthesis protein [Saprospiraceae bacterium]|nr:PhzF family phenazine biosynthesis protein [Bacteroidia bacterium]NNE15787.1 PhzF family phenazine biosynthesis protein [Saprospiraceae bacterium]NNL92227.1 PhzF family phenazine biosynthesis protein [Saprospiraceae bacterium]